MVCQFPGARGGTSIARPGTIDKKIAQAIANKMRNDALLGRLDVVPYVRKDSPTCGELVDRYLETTAVQRLARSGAGLPHRGGRGDRGEGP